jgi:multisubunit Na+/H+ antiporter MnhF subunit
MFTAYDKAIVPILMGIIACINQRYGFHLNADPAALTAIVGAISTLIVYFVPNKPTV